MEAPPERRARRPRRRTGVRPISRPTRRWERRGRSARSCRSTQGAHGQESVWVGSGFSDVASEGRTLLHARRRHRGRPLLRRRRQRPVPPPAPTSFRPTWWATCPSASTARGARASGPSAAGRLAAYVGDLHGRIWKFGVTALSTPQLVQDFGVNQPLGAGLSVLDIAGSSGLPRTVIYGGTRADNRVAVPPAATPPFKLFALADSGTAFTSVFSKDLPERFRGTVQPLVVDSCIRQRSSTCSTRGRSTPRRSHRRTARRRSTALLLRPGRRFRDRRLQPERGWGVHQEYAIWRDRR